MCKGFAFEPGDGGVTQARNGGEAGHDAARARTDTALGFIRRLRRPSATLHGPNSGTPNGYTQDDERDDREPYGTVYCH